MELLMALGSRLRPTTAAAEDVGIAYAATRGAGAIQAGGVGVMFRATPPGVSIGGSGHPRKTRLRPPDGGGHGKATEVS
jgi:hypothetical protein